MSMPPARRIFAATMLVICGIAVVFKSAFYIVPFLLIAGLLISDIFGPKYPQDR